MLLEQLGYSLERCSSDAGHWKLEVFLHWLDSFFLVPSGLLGVRWPGVFRPDTVS